MKAINCIMLIDDNPDDNFFHERVIHKNKAANHVVAMTSAIQALDYLKSKDKALHPDLIFLDINMPAMNGWEFLEQYEKLEQHFKSKAIVVMLTTSENPDDHAKSLTMNFPCDFRTKPLTKEMLEEILDKYF